MQQPLERPRAAVGCSVCHSHEGAMPLFPSLPQLTHAAEERNARAELVELIFPPEVVKRRDDLHQRLTDISETMDLSSVQSIASLGESLHPLKFPAADVLAALSPESSSLQWPRLCLRCPQGSSTSSSTRMTRTGTARHTLPGLRCRRFSSASSASAPVPAARQASRARADLPLRNRCDFAGAPLSRLTTFSAEEGGPCACHQLRFSFSNPSPCSARRTKRMHSLNCRPSSC